MYSYYLCIKRSMYSPTECKKFDELSAADTYYAKHYKNKEIEYSTILPVINIPADFLHKFILHQKVSKELVKIKIT